VVTEARSEVFDLAAGFSHRTLDGPRGQLALVSASARYNRASKAPFWQNPKIDNYRCGDTCQRNKIPPKGRRSQAVASGMPPSNQEFCSLYLALVSARVSLLRFIADISAVRLAIEPVGACQEGG
jgi:hypothetical protein